jgi:hypothetical protein
VQEIEKARAEFLGGRSAKADRIRDALSERHAVVGVARRQIKNVSGRERPLVLGPEVLQDSERRIRHEVEVALRAHAPSPLAFSLHQENVVAVEMRTDAAAGRGVAHHHIVQPRVRDESEFREQARRLRKCEVCALHQQRPAGGRQTPQVAGLERAVANVPACARAGDDARLDAVAGRELEQSIARDRAGVATKRIACQERFFLPVPPQEFGVAQTGKKTLFHVKGL